MKYDGPFEILRKVSSVAYQLRLPTSYGINPIINIAHLEKYNQSPEIYGDRPHKKINRADFETLPEDEVEQIVAERWIKRRTTQVPQYKVRWLGYGPEYDEWKTKPELVNAPLVLEAWIRKQSRTPKSYGQSGES